MRRSAANELQAWKDLLHTCAAASDAVDRDLERAGQAPLHWCSVLADLATQAEGRLPMWELADRVPMTRSGITRLTDRMAEAGLLERQPSPRDRRSIHAVITAASRLTIARMLPVYRNSVQRHFLSHLLKEEVVVLASCLGKIRSAVRKPEGGAVRKPQRGD